MAGRPDKEIALEMLNKRPENFQWGSMTKAEIIAEIEEGTETGANYIRMAQEISINPPEEGSYQLGKRVTCLICGTEGLITKAGSGQLACCGQAMEMKSARPLPSSD